MYVSIQYVYKYVRIYVRLLIFTGFQFCPHDLPIQDKVSLFIVERYLDFKVRIIPLIILYMKK